MRLASRPALKRIVPELAAFGVIGIVCLASDILLFNLLAFAIGLPVLVAKLVGMVITGSMAYFGHRHVTFRHRMAAGHGREVPLFILVTLVTVVLSLLPIYAVRHLADTTDLLWLNVANLAGIALGTVTRYAGYRTLVWCDTAATDHTRSGGGTGLVGEPLRGEDGRDRCLFELENELVRE